MKIALSLFCVAVVSWALGGCSGKAEEFAAAHILISYQGATRATQTRSKEEALALAEEVLSELATDGSNFADLAKQYSDGPSAPKGGYLGSFRRGMMVAPFQQAVEGLAIGEVTRSPVETRFGYHLIQRLDLPQALGANHILIAYDGASRSRATRSKSEAQALAVEVLTKALEEGADFWALARQFSDGPSSASGGKLGEFKEGQMVAPFEAAVKATEIGAVHDSVVETQFGFHIIERTQ